MARTSFQVSMPSVMAEGSAAPPASGIVDDEERGTVDVYIVDGRPGAQKVLVGVGDSVGKCVGESVTDSTGVSVEEYEDGGQPLEGVMEPVNIVV